MTPNVRRIGESTRAGRRLFQDSHIFLKLIDRQGNQ
jgi:hypothetical protein